MKREKMLAKYKNIKKEKAASSIAFISVSSIVDDDVAQFQERLS
jgi:hypothetical protein